MISYYLMQDALHGRIRVQKPCTSNVCFFQGSANALTVRVQAKYLRSLVKEEKTKSVFCNVISKFTNGQIENLRPVPVALKGSIGQHLRRFSCL